MDVMWYADPVQAASTDPGRREPIITYAAARLAEALG
jgi:hypothetical protein